MHHRHAQALRDTFVLGMLVGDADLCASVYAPDACICPPDRLMRCGRDEIREYWREVIYGGGRGDAVISEDLEIRNDRIVESGVYARFTHPVALSEPAVARGSYVVVIDRQPDGTWAWTTDIWTRAH